jgi:hypothetical protein
VRKDFSVHHRQNDFARDVLKTEKIAKTKNAPAAGAFFVLNFVDGNYNG